MHLNESRQEERETPSPCNECGSTAFRTDNARGETICSSCGIVISSRNIDQRPEWRVYSDADRDKRERVGRPFTFTKHDKGLLTIIDWHDKDALGRQLTPKQQAKIHRLRKWQKRARVHSSMERNLAKAMVELHRLSSQLDVPHDVKETAALLYRRAVEKKLVRGRSIEAMITAALYVACRKQRIPRTIDEIARHSRMDRKILGRSYRLMLGKLKITIPQASPTDFIPRFSTELILSGRTQQKAAKIVTLAREKGITTGKDPTGLAAAALYISAILEGERRTQQEIAKVAEVAEVTIRSRYKEMIRELGIHMEV